MQSFAPAKCLKAEQMKEEEKECLLLMSYMASRGLLGWFSVMGGKDRVYINRMQHPCCWEHLQE